MNVLIEYLWYNNKLKVGNIYDHLIKMTFDDKLTTKNIINSDNRDNFAIFEIMENLKPLENSGLEKTRNGRSRKIIINRMFYDY